MNALLSTLSGLLLLIALAITIGSAMNRAPLWVAVLLVVLASMFMLAGSNVRLLP